MLSHAARRYVVFRLSDQAYVLPTEAVDEIVPMAELSRPPCAPAVLAGFLNFGGQPVAVVSMRRLFGLPAREPSLYTPLILLKCQSPRVALEVDEVVQIIRQHDGDAMPIGDRCCLNDCATATMKLGDETGLLLSPERLLLETERCQLAELAQLELERLELWESTV